MEFYYRTKIYTLLYSRSLSLSLCSHSLRYPLSLDLSESYNLFLVFCHAIVISMDRPFISLFTPLCSAQCTSLRCTSYLFKVLFVLPPLLPLLLSFARSLVRFYFSKNLLIQVYFSPSKFGLCKRLCVCVCVCRYEHFCVFALCERSFPLFLSHSLTEFRKKENAKTLSSFRY